MIEVIGGTTHEFDCITEFGGYVADNLVQIEFVQALDHFAGADLVGIGVGGVEKVRRMETGPSEFIGVVLND